MSDPTSQLSSVDPDLEPGQVVGEYQVEDKLGQGGFGAVFKAIHPLIGKVVAIKVLARKFSVDPEMVSRFIAEARAVNQIRHRHIIDIFSFGTLPDGRAYYVMEYLEGEPLDALLERQGPLPLAHALPILRAIGRALDAAHGKGIAHRDLKPENVFLGKDPDGGVFPKLLDFGIAKLLAASDETKHKTRTGIPIGTPYYMSPEQCRGKDVDHRTDYYAFGVVAYQLLTGVHPIDGDDYMAIMMRQITEDPAPPSVVNGDIPTGLDDVILWLMAKDPAKRPPNLVTALRAMEQAAEDSGIAIPKATSTWDVSTSPEGRVATPTPGALRTATPAPKSRTAPPGSAAGVASTMSSASGEPLPATRSRVPLVIGGAVAGAIALGAAVFLAIGGGGGGGSGEKPAGSAAAVITPPIDAAAPAVTIDAAAEIAAAPPDAAVEAKPADVEITIAGAPVGTPIWLGDTQLGLAPGPVVVPRGTTPIELVLKRPGYATAKREVVPARSQTVEVKLKRVGGGGAKRGSGDPAEIENPF